MVTDKKHIRKKFKEDVFKRDSYTCKICGDEYGLHTADDYLDAHHITDRHEMPNGGYVPENGITLCKKEKRYTYGSEESCHMKAEKFHITGGKEWNPAMHPHDLYELIGSSYEEAFMKSEQLCRK